MKLISLFVFLTGFSVYSSEQIHIISVNGIAEASADPNMITLQIESWSKASSAKSAQEIESAQFVKLSSIVEKFKIKKDDFKTENYSVQPETTYDPKTSKSKIQGYRVSHWINLVFKNISEAGKLIDALPEASSKNLESGVNINNISWDTDKKSVIENSVINEAVRNARAQADLLAQAAAVKIKAVHRISYNTSSAPPSASRLNFALKEAMSDEAPRTQINPGKIKIRVEVQMEFEI